MPRGGFAAEVHLQPVAWEPQRIVSKEGQALRSEVAFFPIIHGAVRGSLGGCEVGGLYQFTRLAAEARCGLLQEARGHFVSIAMSGALGADFGPVLGPFGRIGFDLSKSFGPITPLVDVYLSTSTAFRYIENPTRTPIEGPLPSAEVLARPETRLWIPFGVAIRIADVPSVYDPEDKTRVSLVLGAMYWRLLRDGPCQKDNCKPREWTGDEGVGFTAGVQIRR